MLRGVRWFLMRLDKKSEIVWADFPNANAEEKRLVEQITGRAETGSQRRADAVAHRPETMRYRFVHAAFASTLLIQLRASVTSACDS